MRRRCRSDHLVGEVCAKFMSEVATRLLLTSKAELASLSAWNWLTYHALSVRRNVGRRSQCLQTKRCHIIHQRHHTTIPNVCR